MAGGARKGKRERFGEGRLAAIPATSVFINCPYDTDFQPAFDAIVFTTVCCGFTPRSALETGTVAEARMDRIVRAIFSSKYSIHDLSRCGGEGSEQLARFNMPLELGIALARRFVTRGKREQHDWLLLVPEGHQYLKFVSDLAGFDPRRHDGKAESIVPEVVAWLATRPDAVRAVTPRKVLEALPRFRDRTAILQEDWSGHAPWADLVLAAIELSETLV